jgi:hypothetical protein
VPDRGGRQRAASAVAGGQRQLERLDVATLDGGDTPAGWIVPGEVVANWRSAIDAASTVRGRDETAS